MKALTDYFIVGRVAGRAGLLALFALLLLAAPRASAVEPAAPAPQPAHRRVQNAPAAPGDRSEIDRLLERAARGEQLTDAELDKIVAGTPHEEVKVNLIMVPVLVLDYRGRPVEGLGKEDFRLTVDGQERPINWFSEEMNRPFRLAILLDISESMGIDSVRELLRAALVPLAREVGLVDRMMLLNFSDQGVFQKTGWSDRPMAIVNEAIETPTRGRTAIVDALGEAAERFPPSPKDRQAIVLVTDGMDNASAKTVQQAVDAARDVNVPVYVYLLGGLERKIQGRRYTGSPLQALDDVAEQTGGRAYLIDGREAGEIAAARIRDDLRHQYWLSFPPVGGGDGRFHAIDIKVRRSGATVRTRAGYR